MASNVGKEKRFGWWRKLYYRTVPFRFRYGKVFRETFDFLMESECWSREKLLDYQWSELQDLLSYAYENVPYYTRVFDERGLKPSHIQSTRDMDKLPVLTKQIVRDNYEDLISRAFVGKRVTFKTSGSTGDRFQFLGDDSMYKKEAAFILRSFKSHGGHLYDKPSVWLRRYVPKTEHDPLWYFDYDLKRLYMSAYHINKETVASYVKAINDTKSDMLVSYPSSVYILACLLEETGYTLPYIKSVHVTSEMLLDQWKEKAEAILGVPVRAHYGQIERVSFMHQPGETMDYLDNLEYGFTEFIGNNQGDHDIISTGFMNRVMPFIRYQTGDTAILNEPDTRSYGLPLSVKKITGRSDDILITADGARQPSVNFSSMMSKIDGVKMFQFIQKKFGELDVRLVIDVIADRKKVIEEVKDKLRSRLGDVLMHIELVDTIERDPRTHKIRCIQCLIKS
jgi:phenylacetate-CoA ligase